LRKSTVKTATAVGNGYAGFCTGRTYQLHVEHRGGMVDIVVQKQLV